MARKQWLSVGELTHEGFVNKDGVTCYTTDTSNNVTSCSYTSAPSATTGYAVGCVLTITTTGEKYVNTGSVTSCTFTSMAVVGMTSTAAELNYNDITAVGSSQATKSVVLDANETFRFGDWVGSQAAGSAIVFAAGLDKYGDGQIDILSVFGESTSDLTSAKSVKCGRFRHLISCAADTNISHETYGMIGQLSVKNGSLEHYHAGIMGTFETGTLCHVKTSYCAAAVIARPGGSGTTVESGGLLAGFAAVQNMSAITATGTYAAFATHKTAGGVAWPTGLYIQSGSCTKAIDITCAAIGATGRTASITGSIANGNLGDGYGAIELQLNLSGTLAGQVTGMSNWINVDASTVCGSNRVIAQDNGIWVSATGTPMASAIGIIGMRMQYVADGGGNPGALHLFDTNIYSNVLTSLFRVNALVDMGGSTGAATGNDYKVPLFYDQTAGQLWYVNIYHS